MSAGDQGMAGAGSGAAGWLTILQRWPLGPSPQWILRTVGALSGVSTAASAGLVAASSPAAAAVQTMARKTVRIGVPPAMSAS